MENVWTDARIRNHRKRWLDGIGARFGQGTAGGDRVRLKYFGDGCETLPPIRKMAVAPRVLAADGLLKIAADPGDE